VWQVLLGPTGYGDSPYQSFSAFAGNPLLISLETLVAQGLLSQSDLHSQPAFADSPVDFERVIAHRRALWPHILERFERHPPASPLTAAVSRRQAELSAAYDRT
jgi:4-alpha-glucanotransferase